MQDYSAVKDVIAICRDAEQGFRGAAKAVKSPVLKELFEQYSLQRGGFANELHEAARAQGIDVSDTSGVGGVLHSGWMQLKGALTDHSEHQILQETERGEDLSLKTYREAVAMNLSADTRTILVRQMAEVERAHSNIRSLRDSTAKSGERTRTA